MSFIFAETKASLSQGKVFFEKSDFFELGKVYFKRQEYRR